MELVYNFIFSPQHPYQSEKENSLLEEEEKSHSFKTQLVLTAKPHYLKKFIVHLLI